MTTSTLTAGAALLLTCTTLLSPADAVAGNVVIAPVRVYLDEISTNAAIELSNPTDEPISMQVEAFSWHQNEVGEDRYAPSSDLLAFPPIFTIRPGETQLVRVGLAEPGNRSEEQAFRLYFTELPPPQNDNLHSALRMRLRIGVPVFATQTSEPRLGLSLVESQIDGENLFLTLQNSGDGHLRLTELYPEGQASHQNRSNARYLLPGASHQFAVAMPTDTEAATVLAITDQLGVSELTIDWSTVGIVPGSGQLASR